MPSQPEPTTSGSRINPADWGPWRLNPHDTCLEHSTEDYPIDLVTIGRDSAEMLDMIMQVASKSWANDALLAGFVRALDDVLQPQQNLCSWGQNTPIAKRTVEKLVNQARRNGAPLATTPEH